MNNGVLQNKTIGLIISNENVDKIKGLKILLMKEGCLFQACPDLSEVLYHRAKELQPDLILVDSVFAGKSNLIGEIKDAGTDIISLSINFKSEEERSSIINSDGKDVDVDFIKKLLSPAFKAPQRA